MKHYGRDKMRTLQHRVNLFLLLAAAVVLVIYAAPGYPSGKRKIYVSTIGLPFFPNKAEHAKGRFILYRIESMAGAKRYLQGFVRRIELTRRNEVQFDMLKRVLAIRNYAKEYVYLVCSPIGTAIKIEQPYRFRGDKRLIFNVAREPREHEAVLYVRLYVVDKDKDRYTKTIEQGGRIRELRWRAP